MVLLLMIHLLCHENRIDIIIILVAVVVLIIIILLVVVVVVVVVEGILLFSFTVLLKFLKIQCNFMISHLCCIAITVCNLIIFFNWVIFRDLAFVVP